jgi:Putative peptidoglycan binding domain
MALGLVATTATGASQTTATKKTGARSRRHSGHSHSARRNLPAAPTPQRYQEIQQALAARGYFKGQANGTWNSDSADALKRFQTDQNLPPDGKLTALSLIAMGLGPKRSIGTVAAPNPTSTPPATSAAPVSTPVQSNPTPAPQEPAGAH